MKHENAVFITIGILAILIFFAIVILMRGPQFSPEFVPSGATGTTGFAPIGATGSTGPEITEEPTVSPESTPSGLRIDGGLQTE